MKNYLISGMYTTRKNIFKNEQNSNSNHKTNGSPRWGGGESIVTFFINIERTSVVIDGKDFDNLFSHKCTMWRRQGIQLPLKKFKKVMIYWLTWTMNMENLCKNCKIG